MRFDSLTVSAFIGLAAGHAIEVRAPAEQAAQGGGGWHPITRNPAFFNLKINVGWKDCHGHQTPKRAAQMDPVDPANLNPTDPMHQNPDLDPCDLLGYGIRLQDHKVLATPYDRWWDPEVATFFVDDDTAMYTVSKDPLQMYINAQTGQFQYSRVGWLPSEAISLHFFHTGYSPYGFVGKNKASSLLTWPITPGITPGWFPSNKALWLFCPEGTSNARTGQYQVFVDDRNFESSGIDKKDCYEAQLVAAQANPWRKKPHYDHDSDSDSDD